MTTLFHSVQRIVAKQIGINPEGIFPASRFIDLGCDSLDRVELSFAFEEEFDIWLNSDEVDAVDTIAEALRLIESKISQRAAA